MKQGSIHNWVAFITLITLGFVMGGCASGGEEKKDESQNPPIRKVRKVKGNSGQKGQKGQPVRTVKKAPSSGRPGKATLENKSKKKNLLDIQAKDPLSKEKAKEITLHAKTRQALSEWYFKIGKSLYDKFQFEEAEKNFRRAYELYPKNAEAQRYLLLTRYLLDKGYPTYKITSTLLQQEKEVMIQEKKAKMQRAFKRAVSLYDQGQYKEAIRFFEEVIEMIRAFPYQIDDNNYASKAKEYLTDSKRKARLQEIKEIERKQQIALAKAREEELRLKRAHRRKIQKLLKQASKLIQLRYYEKAIQVLEEVLQEDPENRTAAPLLKLAKEGRSLKFRTKVWKDTREYLKQDQENINATSIPFSDFVRFPSKKEWDISRSREEAISGKIFEEPEWVKEYKAKLKGKRVSQVSFKDSSLLAVVKFLQDISGLTIVVDPQMDTTDKNVTLPITDEQSLENVLNLIMDQLGLTYIFKNEAIFITEKGNAVTKTHFVVLNVQDILNPIK
ncbi:MAG: tetratricopeptide repeat protein, partial [Planctomycetota bacterium]